MKPLLKVLVPLSFAAVLLAIGAQAQATEKVLYSFNGSDGNRPDSGVIFDPAGNLYGTTISGGSSSYGNVFELIPSNGTWTESVLHTFNDNGVDGYFPNSVVLGANGDLYGTTESGGSADAGVVFLLSPSRGGWTETLADFDGSDGHLPIGLIFGKDQTIYGTTYQNGEYGYGTAFQLSRSGNAGIITTIYAFSGQGGTYPGSGLVFDQEGNLYGSTSYGGGGACTDGCGTVYELSPATGQWTINVLYSFAGSADLDGQYPVGDLVFDDAGNLYGVTEYGGINNAGTVFELTNSNGNWAETVLHSFKVNGPGGRSPSGGLTFDSTGSLYGTTVGGGLYSGGTVFKLHHSVAGWTERVIYDFCSLPECSDGANPTAGVTSRGGSLYGTTSAGGTAPSPGYGVVYEISP